MEALSEQKKREMGTTEIAKEIRKELKKNFPKCSFSVRTEKFAGGSAITVSLMKAPFKVFRDSSEIPEDGLEYIDELTNRTIEEVREVQEQRKKRGYTQLNPYQLKEEFDLEKKCNGVFITEMAHKVLGTAVRIADKYNWDKSEPITDYFNVNFYFDIEIGKYDKPFKEV